MNSSRQIWVHVRPPVDGLSQHDQLLGQKNRGFNDKMKRITETQVLEL